MMVTNSSGSVTSNPATLTVSNAATTAPKITKQPANQTVNVGQTATFAVTATGTPGPTYQWQKNGVNISGATSTSYITPATVSSDSGATFDVVVTNSTGNVTSGSATLTVNPAGTTFHRRRDHLSRRQPAHRPVHQRDIAHARNVKQSKFGKLGTFNVDGHVDAQPFISRT